MSIEVIILYILFPLLMLKGIKLEGKEEDGEVSFFSKAETNYLKGVAALMVVFAHYCLRLEEEQRLLMIVAPFRYLGPLGVAIFFFLSGYGLYMSHKIDKLSPSFIIKRFLNVYFPYILIRILSIPFSNMIGLELNSFKNVFNYIIGIVYKPFWFVIVIMLIYFIYYIISMIRISENKKMVCLSLAIVFLSIILYLIFGLEQSYWYGNNLLFLFGVLVAKYRDKINGFINNQYSGIFIFDIIAMALGCMLYFIAKGLVLIFVKMLTGVFLVVLLMLILRKISITKSFMGVIGRYSLYIYLLHSDLYRIINYFFNTEKAIVTIIYFIMTIIIPILVKYLIDFIIGIGVQLTNKCK